MKPTSCARNGGRTVPTTRGRRGSARLSTAIACALLPSATQSRLPAAIDPEVAGRTADRRPADDATARQLHNHDLLALRVRDVREPAARRDGGVARRPEVADDRADAQARVDQRQPAAFGVRDEGGPLADALDAAGAGGRLQPAVDLAVGEVDRDDRRLEIGGDERERGATAAPGEGGRNDAERERGCGGCEELATVHVVSTAVGAREVRGTLSGASGVEVVTPPTGGRPCSGCSHPHSSRSRSSRAPPWPQRRPAPGVMRRLGRRSRPARRRSLRRAAGGRDDDDRRRADERRPRCSATRRSAAASAIPLVAFDGTAEGVSRDGTTLVLADVGAPAQEQTRFAVLRTATLRVAKASDASRPLGVRRAVAGRPHALRDPVPRHGREPALQRPLGQPRQRQAGRRRARRQARAGRGDERVAVGARAQRERRLGVHALREAERHRLRPRARHRRAARVLRRSAVADERRSASPPCACRSRTAAARSSSRSRAAAGSPSSTRRPSR